MQAVEIDYALAAPLTALPAATPFETGSDLLSLLRIVADLEQFGDLEIRKVDWRVQRMTDARASLHAISELDLAGKAALTMVRGFDDAEREKQLPRAWSLAAGRRARRVAARLGETESTGLAITVHGPEEVNAKVTRKAARHLKSATDLRLTSYGSVTGELGRVTAHRARRAALWSDVTGRRIEVYFGEQHVEDMRQAWAHPHVEVTGLVHENAAGQVLRVDMESMHVLNAQRVTLAEVLPRAFYPDMTGGFSTAEYLKAIRGED